MCRNVKPMIPIAQPGDSRPRESEHHQLAGPSGSGGIRSWGSPTPVFGCDMAARSLFRHCPMRGSAVIARMPAAKPRAPLCSARNAAQAVHSG
jgi:hypothetical protein